MAQKRPETALKRLVKLCKSAGIVRIKTPDGFELEFEGAEPAAKPIQVEEKFFADTIMPSDEDFLFMASEGLRAKAESAPAKPSAK